MCKVCCLTIKGGCFVGAAIHIMDSLVLMWTFIFDVIKTNKLYWHGLEYDPYLTTHLALIGTYICIYLILGCIILRGIEMDSGKIIVVAAAIFFFLQFIAFIVVLVWWEAVPESQIPYNFQVYDIRVEFARLLEDSRIARFVVRVLANLTYLGTLGMFVRQLVYEDKTAIFVRP